MLPVKVVDDHDHTGSIRGFEYTLQPVEVGRFECAVRPEGGVDIVVVYLGFIDGAVNGVADILKEMALTLQVAQSGLLRSYATLMAIGALAILIFIILWNSL